MISYSRPFLLDKSKSREFKNLTIEKIQQKNNNGSNDCNQYKKTKRKKN